ncbi:hypothetical protein [Nocardiopsis alkaliphila]|uniref:hypothetical protein n=1 Tax=Nocardiopsis alkaliphila TaxID=225762 RepID=UPI00034A472E|nr:hypothetical protein [Nocardiopsis alkaliphila]
MRTITAFSTIVLLWVAIGVAAATRRGYFGSSETNCSTLGSTVVTSFVGPLNHVGLDPSIECPSVPQPSE